MEHNVVYIGNDRCKLYVGSSRRCVVTESGIVLIDGALTISANINMPTDITAYDEIEIDGGFSVDAGTNKYTVLFGQRGVSSNTYPSRLYISGSRIRSIKNSTASIAMVSDTSRHTFVLNKSGFYVDGTKKVTYDGSDFLESTYPVTLWNAYNTNNASINNIMGAFMYRATFRLNGVTLKNYVPAIENGVYGMYDTISQQMLFPTSGSLILFEP